MNPGFIDLNSFDRLTFTHDQLSVIAGDAMAAFAL